MSTKQQAILTGALVAGVLSVSYLGIINLLCCLGVIVGGAVAARRYIGMTGESLEAGDGAVLGAGAGAGGSVLASLLDRVLRPVGLDQQSILMNTFEAFLAPQAMEQLRQQMEMAQQNQTVFSMIFSVLVGLVLFAVFGAIGGAIGASLFSPDDA
jgi:hypothetical protein